MFKKKSYHKYTWILSKYAPLHRLHLMTYIAYICGLYTLVENVYSLQRFLGFFSLNIYIYLDCETSCCNLHKSLSSPLPGTNQYPGA
jgi:hypothetical protein